MGAGFTDHDTVFAHFSGLLETSGIRPALAYLLHLTDYRFVGIFRFSNGMANAAVHYDRENPDTTGIEAVPENTTYCCYIKDSRGAFVTANAVLDDRLQNHPAQNAVPAYCGVPVLDSAGTLLGTLCFYDVVARDPSEIDLAFLIRVASALAYGNHVPPYPEPGPTAG